ncbi:MAG: DUF1540 domain-containing protein [Sandaracinaceae bacterium]|nr:DUF1540 domain-containing protein [Sandaracinaceae bacterium]
MKFVIDMPNVASCAVRQCAYNVDGSCHAKAITVGDGVQPGCDTYLRSRRHTETAAHAGVGACKVEACRHNRDLECAAGSIRVDRRGGNPSCVTFEPAG